MKTNEKKLKNITMDDIKYGDYTKYDNEKRMRCLEHIMEMSKIYQTIDNTIDLLSEGIITLESIKNTNLLIETITESLDELDEFDMFREDDAGHIFFHGYYKEEDFEDEDDYSIFISNVGTNRVIVYRIRDMVENIKNKFGEDSEIYKAFENVDCEQFMCNRELFLTDLKNEEITEERDILYIINKYTTIKHSEFGLKDLLTSEVFTNPEMKRFDI